MRRKPHLILGIVGGVIVAVFFTLIALVAVAIRGTGMLERVGPISLGSLIGLYLAGGVVGGAIFGLLLPITIWRWGAVVVGILAIAPLYFGIAFFLGDINVLAPALCSILVGGIAGYAKWRPPAEGHGGHSPPPGVG